MLICDDHPAFGRGLAALLATEAPELGISAVTTTGEEAVRHVVEDLPDIVLLDIRMPGLDGIEATRRIGSVSPTTKVVVLTASDEQNDLYQALRAGASGYVVKDSDVAEIVAAVRAVLRGQLVIPAHLAGAFVTDLEGRASDGLTDQEREILGRIARGETNREIAGGLHMSERTIRRRIENLYSKLHLADRIDAAVFASREGLTE